MSIMYKYRHYPECPKLEDFSTKTQQAIESLRKEYWSTYFKEYLTAKSKAELRQFILFKGEEPEIRAQQEEKMARIHCRTFVEGWLLARGASLKEIGSACILIVHKNLWIREFVDSLLV